MIHYEKAIAIAEFYVKGFHNVYVVNGVQSLLTVLCLYRIYTLELISLNKIKGFLIFMLVFY